MPPAARTQSPRHWRLAAGLALLLLAGCASADPDYYVLSPVPGHAAASAARVIEVRRVALAGYLDRAEMVRDAAGARLDLRDDLRWAEPLGDMIGRVLTADLAQRLAPATVFYGGGAITLPADLRVELDVTRFDAQGGEIWLEATVALRRGDSKAAALVSLRRKLDGRGAAASNQVQAQAQTQAQTQAMSTLLGLLADQIAQMQATAPQ